MVKLRSENHKVGMRAQIEFQLKDWMRLIDQKTADLEQLTLVRQAQFRVVLADHRAAPQAPLQL
jgi:hypothetical protein